MGGGSLSLLSVCLVMLGLGLSLSSGPEPKDHKSSDPWEDLYGGHPAADSDYQLPWEEKQKEQSPAVFHQAAAAVGTKDITHKHRHSRNTRRHQYDTAPSVTPNTVTDSTDVVTAEGVTIDPDENDYPANCSHCVLRAYNKKYRLQQIRKDILAKLRLDKPPNITDKRLPQIPEIDEWLNKMGSHNEEPSTTGDNGEPVVRIISMLNLAQTPPAGKEVPDMEHVCYFEFHPDVQPADIVSAKLGVFVRPVKEPTDTVTMFLIYRVKPPRRRSNGNTLIKRKRIQLNADHTNRWHKFTVDSVVKSWVRNAENNYGLQIMIYDNYGNSLAIVEPSNSTEELYKPYIEVELKKKKKKEQERERRSLDCRENSVNPSCCRYPMTLDFTGIGWDWVLAPKLLDVNYCSGECNDSYLRSPYIHFASMEKEVIMACCVPKTQSGIKIMYFGKQDRIEFGIINEIVVESCGCT